LFCTKPQQIKSCLRPGLDVRNCVSFSPEEQSGRASAAFNGSRSNYHSPMKRDAQPILEPCGLSFGQLTRLTDEEIMAHIQSGYDDALTVLFDRYHRLVVSVAFRILRDFGEAEDVTQAVFLEVYQASAQFDPARGSTKTWLMQYAYHRSMNRRLHLKRRKFYDQEGSRSADLRSAENPQPVSGGGLFALQELRSLVREGLESLNGPQRRTLHMAYFEGMSLKEIADKTGESFGNVRHHYYRGLSHLRSFVSKGSSHGSTETSTEIVRRGTVDAEA
jgi:RNA polymerase sigma-70 factor (ECF subfamily)